jgi:hypothetical protein
VPAAYWHMYLKSKMEMFSSRKVGHNRYVEYNDISVVVSVNNCSERDLTKRFDNMNIDWPVVERQLIWWGELFRAGKRLRVDLSFNYIDASSQLASTAKPATSIAPRPCKECLPTEQLTWTMSKRRVEAPQSGRKCMLSCDFPVLRTV